MIKVTYKNGLKIKFYPSLSSVFYEMILKDIDRLRIKKEVKRE